MSTLMTTQTPGMVSPPGTVPFSLDAIRRQVLRRVTEHEPPETPEDIALLRMKEDEDTEGPIAHGLDDASQVDDDPSDAAGLNGDCDPADPSVLVQAPTTDAASGGEDDVCQFRPADEPRRNKRKNFRPRNILYDASEEQGRSEAGAASGQEDADDSDDGAIDLSDLASTRFAAGPGASAAIRRRSRKPLFAPQKRYQQLDEDFTAASRFGALDLTCAQKEDEEDSDSTDEDSRSSYPTMQPQSDDSSDASIAGRAPRLFGFPEPRRADASSMKEYAERTMKELLSIYGLGGESAESLTSTVPMANFRSGEPPQRSDPLHKYRKILEALSAVGGPSFGVIPGGSGKGGSLSPANHPFSSSPPAASQPPSTPPRSPQASGTATVPSPQQHGSSRSSSSMPGRDSPNQDVMMTDTRGGQSSHGHPQALVAALQSGAFEDFRSKMADSVAKFSLGPAGVMGDPRVLLPQNVATIMTLAALQDQQSASSRSGNRSPPSLPLDHAKIGGLLHGMQPLGAAPGVRELAAAAAAAAAANNNNNNNNNPTANNNNTKAAVPIDYSRYVKRYGSALECGRSYCKDLSYREHFHCIDCNSRVFVKKEEMIRHFKWHKKRAESLAHGFMRYSPSDDCSDRFRDCSHNRKQTHYHCIKENCDKVYISTSDVQMHANYHRKDSAIIQEGFQRYRATEECRTEYCAFFGQRTTHFHCRRENCKYTFKNKADMEKHKTYHVKDEQLTRDGFKKFMKQDPCPYEGCRFSQNCNHIHCIRSGCSYVLHSSGQLFSHKRKHERKDSELAYRKFKLAQSMIKSYADGQPFATEQMGGLDDSVGAPGGSSMALHNFMAGLHHPQSQQGSPAAMSLSMSTSSSASTSASTSSSDQHQKLQLCQGDGSDGNRSPPINQSTATPSEGSSTNAPGSSQGHPLLSLQGHLPPHFSSGPGRFLPGLEVLPPPPSYLLPHHRPGQHHHESAADLSTSGSASAGSSASASASEDPVWPHPMIMSTPAGATTCVVPGCDALPTEHSHCAMCGPAASAFRTRDAALEHARNHEAQDQVTEAFYVVAGGDIPSGPNTAGHCDEDCPYKDKERHYHCTWETCREIILPSDKPFRRLEHYKMHEYSRKLSQSRDPLTTAHLASSIDAMFRRKRGRPPKNRVIEVWNDYMGSGTAVPDSPQAIFTSFKLPKPTPSSSTAVSSVVTSPSSSSTMSNAGPLMANRQSPLHTQMFAPEQPGSPHSPDDSSNAGSPAGTPHPLDLVQDNFVLFSEGQRCGDTLCSLSGRQHFHCKQPRCFYATEREDILLMHAKDFHDNIDILPGFVFFDRSIDCRLATCHSNKVNRHFHCARSGCGFSFVRYSSMSQHEAKHRGETNNNETAEGSVPSATSGSISAASWAADPGRPEDGASPLSVGEDSSARLGGSPPTANTPPTQIPIPSPLMNPTPTSASPCASTPMSIHPPRPPGTPLSGDRTPTSIGTPLPSSSALVMSPGDSGSRMTVVKASGTFYPLSTFSCSSSGGGGSNAKGGTVFPKCLTPQSPMRAPSPTAVPHLAPLPGHPTGHPLGHPSGMPATGVRGPTPPHERRHHFVADIVKNEADRPSLAPHSLARLLQSQNVEMTESPGHNFLPAEQHIRYGPDQSCSRPFCKLKRKEHYHCQACNQAFSELERLRPHITKHSSGALSPQGMKREADEGEDEDSNGPPTASTPSSASAPPPYDAPAPTPSMDSAAAALGLSLGPPGAGMPPPPPFPPHSFNAAMAAAVANQQFALITSQGLPFMQHGLPAVYTSPSGLMFAPTGFGAHHALGANGLLEHRLLAAADASGGNPSVHQHLTLSAGLKRSMSPHIMNPQDMSPEAKKARIQNSMRILKDEPVPEGYIRFRFNEDCKYPHCGYREHQTHFHCMRQDCGYSFCDKTRFVQHTARHERLDTLMGGDFQQFRANVSCSRPDCVYTTNLGAVQNKASHFHCLKCDFVCTDTNKVVAHRRQHQKLDSIMAAGFEKFTPSQPCHSESCAHSGKQTHYHCLSCQYAVLGLSQMSAHKFRHME